MFILKVLESSLFTLSLTTSSLSTIPVCQWVMSVLPSVYNWHLNLPFRSPATILVQSTVISYLDYCNTLLLSLLWSVISTAARVTCWGQGQTVSHLVHIYSVFSFLTQSISKQTLTTVRVVKQFSTTNSKTQNGLVPVTSVTSSSTLSPFISQASYFGLLGCFLNVPGTLLPQGLCTCCFLWLCRVFFPFIFNSLLKIHLTATLFKTSTIHSSIFHSVFLGFIFPL